MVEKTIEFNDERSKRYHLAMHRFPEVRDAELEALDLDSLRLNKKMRILDLGAGEGYLTRYLAGKFEGSSVHAVDDSKSMLPVTQEKENIFYINTYMDNLPFQDNSFDLVISLASFHHITNKEKVFKEVERVLAPNGIFIIADVMDNTPTQRFFDDVVREYCITGHNFPFLDIHKVKVLSQKAGLNLKSSHLKNTPWIFNSEEDLANFVKNLLGLEITESQLLKEIKRCFPQGKGKKAKLSWQLGYYVIVKNKCSYRVQENHIMHNVEKESFTKIIRATPWLYHPILDKIEERVLGSESLLDVACGDGYLLELVSKKLPNLSLSGVDIDSDFIALAKNRYEFNFFVGDALKIKKTYDIITCNLSLHHFDNAKRLIRTLIKHTKRALIISDQIRPSSEQEISERLARRKNMLIGKDVPFYEENERNSIAEAYSKEEIITLVSSLAIPFSIEFRDEDYYERFVIVFNKEVVK